MTRAAVCSRRLSSGLLCALAFGLGCAHTPGAPTSMTPERAERRLLVLESEFAEFVADPLILSRDGHPLEPDQALVELDLRIAALESLRLRYLDLLRPGSTHRQRVVAMVRMAELHLDLGARIRRLPYPTGATEEEMRTFDERLSRAALPLEATGLGILRQVVDYTAREGIDGRFVRRARLYLALHDGAPGALERGELMALRHELAEPQPFPAPRRLLETGRVGQRASRR